MKPLKIGWFGAAMIITMLPLCASALAMALGQQKRPIKPPTIQRQSLPKIPGTTRNTYVPCSASRMSFINRQASVIPYPTQDRPYPTLTQDKSTPPSKEKGGIEAGQKTTVLIGGPGDGKEVKRHEDGS